MADRYAHLIVLVHGTRFTIFDLLSKWSGSTDWTEKGSAFRKQIELHVRPDTLVEVFRWSGKNSHRKRRRAAGDLKVFLQRILAEQPDIDDIDIIAHSHGGNVALNALSGDQLAKRVSNLICLATPFITCLRRDLEPSQRLLKILAGFVPASIFALTCLSVGIVAAFYKNEAAFVYIALLVCAWPTSKIYKLVYESVDQRFSDWAYRKQDEACEGLVEVNAHFSPEVLAYVRKNTGRKQRGGSERLIARPLPDDVLKHEPLPLTAITYRGDEAKRYLTFLSGLSRLPFLFWSITFAIWDCVAGFVSSMWRDHKAVTDRYVTHGGLTDVPPGPSLIVTIVFFPLVILSVLLAILMLILWCTMLVIPFLLRGHVAGFGEGLTRNLWADMRVSLAPKVYNDKKTRVIELSTETIEDHRVGWKRVIPRFLLLHTLVYRDPTAVSRILAIVKEGQARIPAGTGSE